MGKISTLTAALLFCGFTGAAAQTATSGLTTSDIKLTAAKDTTWYVISSYNRGGVLTAPGGIDLQHTTYTYDNAAWCFIKADDNTTGKLSDGVYIQNRAGRYVKGNSASTTPTTIYVTDNTIGNIGGIVLSTAKTITDNTCVDASNANIGTNLWKHIESDYQGTTWMLEAEESSSASLATVKAAANKAITNATTLKSNLTAYTSGTGLGQYNFPENYEATLAAAITTATTAVNATDATIASINTAVSALSKLQPVSYLNMPAAPCFLRIKTLATDITGTAYLASANSTVSGKTDRVGFKETAGIGTIFLYDTDSKLTAYDNGYQITTPSMTKYNGVADGGAFTFEPSAVGTISAYNLVYTRSMGATIVYTNGAGAATAAYTDAWGKGNTYSNQRCDFALEDVTTLPVTIGEAGYATLNLPVAVTIPEGVTAYTGTKNGEYLVLNKLEGTIPANTPVVLQGAAKTYDFAIATEATAAVEASDPALTGTLKAENIVSGSLTLQKIDDTVGFYTYTGSEMKGFKAYINGTTAAGAKALLFGGNVTGINGVTVDATAPKAIYDLQGRRVSKAVKGLYIINGAKVLVK